MINDEICKLREKLNKSIEDGKDYEEVYKLSVELDELIAKYYKQCEHNTKKNK
ncbi:MAG: aspartyl-phosphate phosphatase Spo0E family protein [Clostridia bacterium]|nr:aspartyl-phosphate phosphatase Spo0E family protein [Clostridia bacterium]